MQAYFQHLADFYREKRIAVEADRFWADELKYHGLSVDELLNIRFKKMQARGGLFVPLYESAKEYVNDKLKLSDANRREIDKAGLEVGFVQLSSGLEVGFVQLRSTLLLGADFRKNISSANGFRGMPILLEELFESHRLLHGNGKQVPKCFVEDYCESNGFGLHEGASELVLHTVMRYKPDFLQESDLLQVA